MWYYDTWPGGVEVLLAPLFIALAVLTALGGGLLLSAVNVRFRDVRYMIPVILQVLPLLSGVQFAVSSIPTKWQWILAFNPMTAVISGWRWAVLDAPEPVWGQVAVGVAVDGSTLRRRARGVSQSRAPLRGHDLMPTVIRAEGLGQAVLARRAPGRLRNAARVARPCWAPRHRARAPARGGGDLGVRDVSFEVQQGEVLGIIGRNGAGKSTLLKVLTRITLPTAGRVEIRGRVGSLLEVGTGFNPELTGRENVYLNGAILGMKRREIDRRYDAIVEFSGVEKFIDTPVKRYSSGMYVRLAFAVAAHLEPEILLVDEVLAVGDAEFQRRCLGRMEELGSSGRTVIFVSHQLPAVAQMCDRAIQINGGTRRRRRPPGRGDRQLPPPDPQLGVGAIVARSQRTGERPCEDPRRYGSFRTTACRRGSSTSATRSRSRSCSASRARASRCFRRSRCWIRKARSRSMRWTRTSGGCSRPRQASTSSTAWIPGNLLNEGSVIVEAAICSIDFPKLEHHAAVYEAISFEVLDPGEGDSARGAFAGQWRGVVRPKLDWTVERE